MKKFHKIFSCLFMCTVFSYSTFFPASAMFAMFNMDEDFDALEEVKPKTSHQLKIVKSTGEPQATKTHYNLQTLEMIREQEGKFRYRYEAITKLKNIKINLLRELKLDIFNYLKILYNQIEEHPGIINDQQIMDLFLRLVLLFNPYKPETYLPQGDYILRFDSMLGLYGSIICLDANAISRALVVL